MTRTRSCIFLLAAAALLSTDAAAFCVYNGLKDRDVSATIVSLGGPKPAKLYAERVAPGKESCCNPKNTECNPAKVPDLAPLAFEARVEGKAGTPAQVVACGKPTLDKRFASGVDASIPARAYARFEANPAFNAQQKYGWENPPFLLKVLVGSENRLVATFSCPPKQDGKPGRVDFLK